MFERFTDRARRTVVLAQDSARELNHNYIGTEHILLGLIREGEGVAAQVLHQLGHTIESLTDGLLTHVAQGENSPSGHIPFTPRSKKTLELALREALQLGNNYVGTEHILLGLIREGEGLGAQLLGEEAPVRKAVVEHLSRYATPPPPPPLLAQSKSKSKPESAIERVMTNDRLRGYTDIQLAIEEAFTKGRADALLHVTEPETVQVHVPGVPYESEDGNVGACDWPASIVKDVDPHRHLPTYAVPAHFLGVAQRRLAHIPTAPPPPATPIRIRIPGLASSAEDGYWTATFESPSTPGYGPVYKLEGDPNAVAVGRFKASLRKFLGVD